MLRPRWQKVLVDLWSNRARTLMVVASIAVGLFAIGVIMTVYWVIKDDMKKGYAAVHPANVSLHTDLIDDGMVDHLSRMPLVEQAQGARTFSLRALDRNGEWTVLDLNAVEDWSAQPLNQLTLLEGTWPRKGETLLSDRKLQDLNVKVGDPLTVELASGKTAELVVSGIVKDLTIGAYTGSGGYFRAPVQGYVTQDSLEMLGVSGVDRFNTVYLTVGGAQRQADLEKAAATLADDLKRNGVEVSNSKATRSDDHPNSSLVDAIIGVLLVLGLLCMFLSSFLVTNMVQALLNQQTQQIGIMKTIGGRRMQIVGVYLAMILVFGGLAFAIACPLAYWVAFPMLGFLADQLNFVLMGQRFLPQVVALQAALALLIPLLAAWLPVWQGTRIRVREALSGIKEEGSGRKGKSSRWKIPGMAKLSRPVLMAFRNVFRRKGRLMLTLFTFSLAGAVFIATFNVQVSMDRYVERLSHYFGADVNLSLQAEYRNERVVSALQATPGVGAVEVWAATSANLILDNGAAGERVQVLAPPLGSELVSPILLSGRWLEAQDHNAIVLSELFMLRYPDLDAGETVRLSINERDTEWVVVGFFQMAGKNGGFSAYTQYADLASLLGQPKKSASFRITGTHPGMTPAEQDVLAEAVQQTMDREGIRVSEILTGSYLAEVTADGFNTLTAFLLFLSVLTALIGSIGLAGTMSMNVMERTREIGILRSVGAADSVLARMVLVEGLTIGLISYGIGSLLSFPITSVLSNSITRSLFGSATPVEFTAQGFLIWLGLVLLLSFLSSIAPAMSAARMTIREVLAYE